MAAAEEAAGDGGLVESRATPDTTTLSEIAMPDQTHSTNPMTIKPFLFEGEHLVRVGRDKRGHTFFVGIDVCRILGIKKHEQALGALDSDQRGTCTIGTPGGIQSVIGVTESGLYTLIFRSRKPAAIRFTKWVTDEVMPSIRKTGTYSLGGHRPKDNADLALMKATTAAVNAARGIFGELRRSCGVRTAAKTAPAILAKLGIEVAEVDIQTLDQLELTLGAQTMC